MAASDELEHERVEELLRACTVSLGNIPFGSVQVVGTWLQAHLSLGYRLLGRMLLSSNDEEPCPKVVPAKIEGWRIAKADLAQIDRLHKDRVLSWWETWISVTGHKRLGQLVLNRLSLGPVPIGDRNPSGGGIAASIMATVNSTGMGFQFGHAHLDSSAIFSSKSMGATTQVILNSSHPIFLYIVEALTPSQFSTPGATKIEYAAKALDLLITAWVRYEEELPEKQRQAAIQARLDWGRVARRLARESIDRD